MKETDYQRSEAFIEDYHELCEKHGVRIEQLGPDFFVAVAELDEYGALFLYSQREWDELQAAARPNHLKRFVRHSVENHRLLDRPALSTEDVVRGLHWDANYQPAERPLVEKLISELKQDEPELFWPLGRRPA